VSAIEVAEHFVYIENQFFVTNAADPVSTEDGDAPSLVQNRIGYALYRRIKRAHEAGRPFRVMVVLPLMPAFTGRPRGEKTGPLASLMKLTEVALCCRLALDRHDGRSRRGVVAHHHAAAVRLDGHRPQLGHGSSARRRYSASARRRTSRHG